MALVTTGIDERIADRIADRVADRIADRVADRALAFAATLSPDQQAALLHDMRRADLRSWSNYPQAVLGRRHRRRGLATSTLDARQWAALDELLAAALGTGADLGLDRVRSHLIADDHLYSIGGTYGYGHGEFTVAVLGTPSGRGRWHLHFGGHHLAVALTYDDGILVGATPAFRGIEPVSFVHDGVRFTPELRSERALRAMLGALEADQRYRARLRGAHDDLLLGPGRDGRFPKRPDGLVATELDAGQRALVLAAIESFVADVDAESAARIMAGYTAELDATHIGWSGSTDLRHVGDYVRIDGPSVWLEWSVQDGIVCAGPHPHAVWRDRVGDYGGIRF